MLHYTYKNKTKNAASASTKCWTVKIISMDLINVKINIKHICCISCFCSHNIKFLFYQVSFRFVRFSSLSCVLLWYFEEKDLNTSILRNFTSIYNINPGLRRCVLFFLFFFFFHTVPNKCTRGCWVDLLSMHLIAKFTFFLGKKLRFTISYCTVCPLSLRQRL